MNIKRRIVIALTAGALAATGFSALSTTAQAAPTDCAYQSTLLPVPTGATAGEVTAVAGQGLLAGTVSFPIPTGSGWLAHAALWTDGVLTDLGVLPGSDYETSVYGLNSSGIAVGRAGKLTGLVDGWPIIRQFPFRSRDGHLEQLPVPAGAHDVYATVITESGDIYGQGYAAGDPNRTVLFSWPADQPGTVIQEQAGFPAGSLVADADADGTLALNSTTGAYLWKGGVAKKLPLPAGAGSAAVHAVSNGRAVGSAGGSVVWDQNGTVKKLPNSYGTYDINADGLIIGLSDKPRVYALWQLTTAKGGIPGGGRATVVGAASSLYGAKAAAGTDYPALPAVWRCS